MLTCTDISSLILKWLQTDIEDMTNRRGLLWIFIHAYTIPITDIVQY